MREAVGNTFAVHWPYKQLISGRNLCLSPIHGKLDEAEAVWGVGGAWERTLWFAESEEEKTLPYSIGPQTWLYVANREAQAMALMQWISTANMDVGVGRVVCSTWLNQRGGTEADLTVTRTGQNSFRATSGAATRRNDL